MSAMSTTDTTHTGSNISTHGWRRGLAAGVLTGALVWLVYFVQASTIDAFSWETSVAPGLVAVVVAAVVVALLRPAARTSALALALGAFLTLPLVLGAFAVVFAVLDLE
jgi:hypothetical protein